MSGSFKAIVSQEKIQPGPHMTRIWLWKKGTFLCFILVFPLPFKYWMNIGKFHIKFVHIMSLSINSHFNCQMYHGHCMSKICWIWICSDQDQEDALSLIRGSKDLFSTFCDKISVNQSYYFLYKIQLTIYRDKKEPIFEISARSFQPFLRNSWVRNS